jgi:hypothetical protein
MIWIWIIIGYLAMAVFLYGFALAEENIGVCFCGYYEICISVLIGLFWPFFIIFFLIFEREVFLNGWRLW